MKVLVCFREEQAITLGDASWCTAQFFEDPTDKDIAVELPEELFHQHRKVQEELDNLNKIIKGYLPKEWQ